MSLLTTAIGTAKKLKRALKTQIDAHTPVYLSPVRRIERVKTNERVCAMTFDDGPMNMPPSPDNHGGKPLTLVLLETLEEYGAHGTFDVIGDTSANYPDEAGTHGSASWGGVKYDHYPDINKDNLGGVYHCPDLTRRILEGGHEITSHTYAHVLFGKKPLVYGARSHLNSLEEVTDDLHRLDKIMTEQYGYKMKLMRPPHYVDNIKGGYSSYDACALMGYQYMGASFDGAGWLPLRTYELEVEATWKPIEAALERDPDELCGQIIFQKDGYNMARRTPIADGLPKALEILKGHGYRVVSVSELLSYSPFEDLGANDALFPAAVSLLNKNYTIVFRNNRVMPETPITLGAFIMMLYGHEGAERRIDLISGKVSSNTGIKPYHPYSGAISVAHGKGVIRGKVNPEEPLTQSSFDNICRFVFGKTIALKQMTHGDVITALAELDK